MLRQAFKSGGPAIEVPRQQALRPDSAFLARRYELFLVAG